jgi:hypothetical protein
VCYSAIVLLCVCAWRLPPAVDIIKPLQIEGMPTSFPGPCSDVSPSGACQPNTALYSCGDSDPSAESGKKQA